MAVVMGAQRARSNPITNCQIGRHTLYENNKMAGSCGYGSLLGAMGPGNLYIAALNDYEGNGFGYRAGTSCGVCYQVTGITSSVTLMVTDHCPDCPTLQAHFDMSPEASAVVDGNSVGKGFTAVSWREVECPVGSKTVKIQQGSDSNQGFLRLLVSFHRVRLAADITVAETGKAAYSVTRKSFGFWDFNPSSYPVTVTLYDFRGNTITQTFDSVSPGTIFDTKQQFPAVPAGFNGSPTTCTQCSAPWINNGQTLIYTDSLFPEQNGEWLPKTSQAWSNYGAQPSPATSNPSPFAGSNSASFNSPGWGTLFNLGSNVDVPSSEVASISFAVRTKTASAKLMLRFCANCGDQIVSPDPNPSSWTQYVIPVAGQSSTPASLASIYFQNFQGTSETFYFDEVKFNFAPTNDICTPWVIPTGGSSTAATASSHSTGGSGSSTAATTTTTTPDATSSSAVLAFNLVALFAWFFLAFF